MECILKADPYYPKYIRGQIQFGLNFIEISPENVEEGYSFSSVFYCSVQFALQIKIILYNIHVQFWNMNLEKEVIDLFTSVNDLYCSFSFRLVSFCEFPMACLHEGVFLNRSHAEQYISIFSPQVDPFQRDGPRSACKQHIFVKIW